MRRARLATAACGFALVWLGSVPTALAALAARPVLAGEQTFGQPGGDILVHYATTGADAPPTTDSNGDGVPDFVAQVAAEAELALDHYIELGFRRPLDDGALGGDGRIDIYLVDLVGADGSTLSDSCDGDHCIGFFKAENDFAGYSYASITEGIRSVVPHELFHLVQNAYSNAQPSSWLEGSAVWAVENLYGNGCSDFERFLPSFLPKSFRPFDRPVASFVDPYPYGAAVWPYFLEHRFGVDVVVASWEASEHATYLDAFEAALKPAGSSVDAAWTEMTRWDVFTGVRAGMGPYPDASTWPAVSSEPGIAAAGGMVYVEGLSARYVPIVVANRSRIKLAPGGGIRIAAWLVADGHGFADGVELAADQATLATTVDPGVYLLVVTGLSRGTVATAVTVAIEPAGTGDDAGGGCSASAPAGAPVGPAAFVIVLAWRRRRAPR